MPRGPGKKENYNFDYSRFNGVDPEVEAAAAAEVDSSTIPSEVLRHLPGELQEAFRLMQVANQTGDIKAQERANELALKAVERGGPEMKQRFQQEVMRQAAQKPESKRALEAILSGGQEPPKRAPVTSADLIRDGERMDQLSNTIDKLQTEMKAGAEQASKQLDAMREQQEKLEKLQGPEDFARFMAEQGISTEDLQRCMAGDEAHMKGLMERALGKLAPEPEAEAKKSDPKKLDQMLETVDKIHRQLNDVPDTEPPPLAPSSPSSGKAAGAGEATSAGRRKEAPAKPKEPEVKIPEHRVQYQKDPNGRLLSVELRCELPGVGSMADIEVDVSETYLRLRTLSPPYVVNVGPFPNLVDAPAAKAKFSKKRQELTLSVPAKP